MPCHSAARIQELRSLMCPEQRSIDITRLREVVRARLCLRIRLLYGVDNEFARKSPSC